MKHWLILGVVFVGGLRAGEIEYRSAAGADVRANAHAGGALVIGGANARLPRVSYHLDVHIEDGFARTTVDQIYFNTTQMRQEGRYLFPLPVGASISRLAMYVNGERMEGGMVERQRAAEVYDTILRKRRDPVLLEWMDGRTFKMRVFPIEPREHKRILLSYTERLRKKGEMWHYRFPGGDAQRTGKWSAQVRIKGGAGREWSGAGTDFSGRHIGGDLLLESEAIGISPAGEIGVSVDMEEGHDARFEVVESGGDRYAIVRWKADHGGLEEGADGGRDWIVVFEASGDRDPVEVRRQIELVKMLEAVRGEGTVRVIVANTGAEVLAGDRVSKQLGRIHLIGALDLGQAFERAGELAGLSGNPVIVHVGEGRASSGEREVDALVDKLPKRVRYFGAGVGGDEDSELMRAAAQHSGGAFLRVEAGADMGALLGCVSGRSISDIRMDAVGVGDFGRRYLTDGRMVEQGGEVFAVARLSDGEALPEAVTISGWKGDARWERVLRADWRDADAGYISRVWARLEIGRLIAEGAEGNRERTVALSRAQHVMSPFTSLLVLESAAMHEEYGVERGVDDHWAKYPAPERMLPKVAPDVAATGNVDQELRRAVIIPEVRPLLKGGYCEIELEFPKPVFIGTPVRVDLPNLEGRRRDSGDELRWRPMFEGKEIEIRRREEARWTWRPRRSFLAPVGSGLLSKGANVTASDRMPIIGELEFVTDGEKSGFEGSYVELGPGEQWVQIDLGALREIWGIALWHYHSSARAYKDVVVLISDDPKFEKGVVTVFNSDDDNSLGFGVGMDPAYIETNYGRIIDFPGRAGRYVRLWSNGNTMNDTNHYVEVEVCGFSGVGERWAGAKVAKGRWEVVAELERLTEEGWSLQDGEIDLGWLRRSHGTVLDAMIEAMEAGEKAPVGLAKRAIRIADRWWGVDGGSPDECEKAARLMGLLGRRDLQWAYLTTPVAIAGGSSGAWREVVRYGRNVGDSPVERRAVWEMDNCRD